MSKRPVPLDLDPCLAALRGDAVAHDEPTRHSGSARAGRLLRALVLEQAPQDAPNEQALLARLRAAGVFDRPQVPARRRWLDALSWRWLAPSALLALSAVIWLQPDHKQDLTPPVAPYEGDVMRGDELAQQLVVEQPLAFAFELVSLLQAHHVVSRQVALSSGALQVQAMIPPALVELRGALAQRGIQTPEHGRLFLIISPPKGK